MFSGSLSASTVESGEFVHCYNFGCKSTENIDFSVQQWQRISELFGAPALSPWLEKQQIRHAVALMESFSGQLAGTADDRGGNYTGENLPRQQDCIDESTNTFQYLHALQKRGLLHWHDVAGKKRRIVWFFTHWAAVIRDKISDQLFAVDSWYRDNGEPPYIQPLADWRWKKAFPNSLNP